MQSQQSQYQEILDTTRQSRHLEVVLLRMEATSAAASGELFADGVVAGHEVTNRYLTKLWLFLSALLRCHWAPCAEATARWRVGW